MAAEAGSIRDFKGVKGMAMVATGSYEYGLFPEVDFTPMWRGTEDRSTEFEKRMESLFTCPTCRRTKTGTTFCSSSFHL